MQHTPLHVVWLQACFIKHHIVVSRGDSALANVLAHQKEIVAVSGRQRQRDWHIRLTQLYRLPHSPCVSTGQYKASCVRNRQENIWVDGIYTKSSTCMWLKHSRSGLLALSRDGMIHHCSWTRISEAPWRLWKYTRSNSLLDNDNSHLGLVRFTWGGKVQCKHGMHSKWQNVTIKWGYIYIFLSPISLHLNILTKHIKASAQLRNLKICNGGDLPITDSIPEHNDLLW